jgi:Recombinase
MKLTFCAACGSTDDLQHHHLKGSNNDETNLITLCCGCLLKLHKAGLVAQGAKLGGLNARSIASHEEARARAEALRPILNERSGLSSRAIAAELNARKIPTPSGRAWRSVTVLRVQQRLK